MNNIFAGTIFCNNGQSFERWNKCASKQMQNKCKTNAKTNAKTNVKTKHDAGQTRPGVRKNSNYLKTIADAKESLVGQNSQRVASRRLQRSIVGSIVEECLDVISYVTW